MIKFTFVIVITFLLSASAIAQIPNGDFENWSTSNGYDVPINWDNFNSLTASKSVFTCERGYVSGVTDAYIRLVSDSVEGFGVVPGIAVCGVLDKITSKPKSGFAYIKRPSALKGKRQFMAPGDDRGFILVYFTKWNMQMKKRDTIGSGKDTLDGMAMGWTDFNIPISFSNSSSPDSCIILLSASSKMPIQYSYLFVNELSFDLSAGIFENDARGKRFEIFPNPATDRLQLNLLGLKGIIVIQLLNRLY